MSNDEWPEPEDLAPFMEQVQRDVADLAARTWTPRFPPGFIREASPADPHDGMFVVHEGRRGIAIDVRSTGLGEWTFSVIPDPFD